MASTNLELHLSAEDRQLIAQEVFALLEPHLKADTPMFWSEKAVAEWVGVSRQTLAKLRHAGVITPERNSPPIGYGPASRQALVRLMEDGPEWARAMEIGRSHYARLAAEDTDPESE